MLLVYIVDHCCQVVFETFLHPSLCAFSAVTVGFAGSDLSQPRAHHLIYNYRERVCLRTAIQTGRLTYKLIQHDSRQINQIRHCGCSVTCEHYLSSFSHTYSRPAHTLIRHVKSKSIR